MAKLRIHKGDKVKVISGKDKGAVGSVMRVIPESQRVIVEKVAIAKKAQRPTRDNPSGGIINIEKPIHVSTVMLVCPKCNQPSRLGIKIENGKKTRICKKCGKSVD